MYVMFVYYVQKMTKLFPLGTKKFVWMKTSYFIFYGRKPKFDIFIRTKNLFNRNNYRGNFFLVNCLNDTIKYAISEKWPCKIKK